MNMKTLTNLETAEMEREVGPHLHNDLVEKIIEIEVGPHLHDDLVEKIIAMMPFPAIFKARCLSKTWQARLSSVPADDEEAKRCLVPSFHRQIFQRSMTCDTIWSVFMRKGSFFGYDRRSQSWLRMPSVSFVPRDEVFESGVPLPDSTMFESTRMQIEGPILFTCRLEARESKCVLYLANILTRSWRPLQLPPLLTDRIVYQKLVTGKSAKSYRLILLGVMDMDQAVRPFRISIQIYDSKSDSWKIDFFQDLQWTYYPNAAGLHNGVLYITSIVQPQHLLSYNLEDGTWNSQRLLLDLENLGWEGWGGWRGHFSIEEVNLLTHKADLLLVVGIWHGYRRWNSRVKTQTQVLRIDLDGERLLKLADHGPIEGRRRYAECFMDGNCIILGTANATSRRIFHYNLDTKEWGYFRSPIGRYKWIGSCFQPSLNSFMVV